MHRTLLRVSGLAVVVGTAIAVASQPLSAQELKFKTDALELEFSGRVHMQFNTSSVSGVRSSEFLLRRVRMTADVKINDFVSGRIQPEYAITSVRVRDVWARLTFSPTFRMTFGQFKRPFDVFALTSSTQILVVERTGSVRGVPTCGGVGFCSYSGLSEGLLFSDRDAGVLIDGGAGSWDYAFSVTNGTSQFVKEENGTKSYAGRAAFLAAEGVKIGANLTYKDYVNDVTGNDDYAAAYAVDVDIGNFNSGLHVQAGVMGGQNWRNLDVAGDASNFATAQAIVTYKTPVTHSYVSAIEPVARVSWANPDTDTASDGAWLFTPGVQFFFVGRNKISANIDIYVPDAGDTELSLKVQSYLHF